MFCISKVTQVMFAHFTKISHTISCERLPGIVLALVLAPIEPENGPNRLCIFAHGQHPKMKESVPNKISKCLHNPTSPVPK